MKKTLAFLTVIALSTPCYADYLVGATAIVGGSCSSFGGGWETWAYDSVSRMTYCKQISRSRPAEGIVEMRGLWRSSAPCGTLGTGWREIAYDSLAQIRFCAQYADPDTSDYYIENVSAIWGTTPCDTVGRGWETVVWNGFSRMSFCARFR
jgi:hypothetical protein